MKSLNRKALIIGVNGQDGRILFDFLASLNYSLIGISVNNLKTFRTKWNKKIDIYKKNEVCKLVKKIKPDEIYYLAAFHQSSQDKKIDLYKDIECNYATNVMAFLNFLEAVRLFSRKTRIFYASSSLVFGNSSERKQNEKTPFNPNSPYGITKMNGLLLGQLYREKHGIFVSSGILYNHESVYRRENFISMKIIKSAIEIKNGSRRKLVVGDLSALVDWGYAPDYVRAMHAVLNLKTPQDFVIATGRLHSVFDFIKIVFNYLGLDWQKLIVEDKSLIREKKHVLRGDYTKLKNETGWRPSVSFSGMIKKIINQLENQLN